MTRVAGVAAIAVFLAVNAVTPIGGVSVWQLVGIQASDEPSSDNEERLADRSLDEQCKRKTFLPIAKQMQDQVCSGKVKLEMPKAGDFQRSYYGTN